MRVSGEREKSQLVSFEENQRLFSCIYVNFSNSILSLIVVNTYVIGVSGYKFKSCGPDQFIMNIKKVVIIGSGTMGSGIAAHLCNANIPVTLLDLKTEILSLIHISEPTRPY